jgi:hypothetical protein
MSFDQPSLCLFSLSLSPTPHFPAIFLSQVRRALAEALQWGANDDAPTSPGSGGGGGGGSVSAEEFARLQEQLVEHQEQLAEMSEEQEAERKKQKEFQLKVMAVGSFAGIEDPFISLSGFNTPTPHTHPTLTHTSIVQQVAQIDSMKKRLDKLSASDPVGGGGQAQAMEPAHQVRLTDGVALVAQISFVKTQSTPWQTYLVCWLFLSLFSVPGWRLIGAGDGILAPRDDCPAGAGNPITRFD